MKMPVFGVETIDRETTTEEVFRLAEDEMMCESGHNSVSPPAAPHSMDYQWYEVPPDEFISLMAVCVSGQEN